MVLDSRPPDAGQSTGTADAAPARHQVRQLQGQHIRWPFAFHLQPGHIAQHSGDSSRAPGRPQQLGGKRLQPSTW